MTRRGAVVLAGALVGAVGCGAVEPPSTVFLPTTPHERYEFAFRQMGLEGSALGFRWIAASQSALDEALPVAAPYHEAGYFDPSDAPSLGYRLQLMRGQELLVDVDVNDLESEVFIDLYRVIDDTLRPHRHVAYADSGSSSLSFFVNRTAEYVLRLQPELLAGGRYDVAIIQQASLSFPVEGHGLEAIRSGFGAPRDRGRRQHHGVDIFAPRGTPVLAAADGRISSTRRNNLGGKVVWLRSRQGSLYYAHLDSVHVRRRDNVRVGDTVGFVGNSGNARTTPPHLHFGVYSRGPADPYPYLYQPPTEPQRLTANRAVIGSAVRTAGRNIALRESPTSRGALLDRLDRRVPLRVLGGTGGWLRVGLPDGNTGFVWAESTESLDQSLRREVVADRTPLLDRPGTLADAVTHVAEGEELGVLGEYSGYLYVSDAAGTTGWLATPTVLDAAAPGEQQPSS